MKRKRYTPEEKARIVLLGLRSPGTGRARVFGPETLEPLVRRVLRELPPVAGHRRVRIRLRKRGIALSESTAYRVCRDLGLLVPRRGRGRRRKVELIRVEGPNLAWVVDTTEWHLADGEKVYAYLAVDAFSRFCPALMAATSEDAFHTVRFYEDAFREGAPAAVHTDGGREFDNRDARAYLREREVRYRVGPPHTPKAQAFVERFVRTLKEEWLVYRDPRSIKELQGCLDAFRTWYDREREHSSLDYRMPEAVHHA